MEKYPAMAALLPALVGVIRSTGQHAGGVCIAECPIADETPVVRAGAKEGGNIVTAFGESGAERALESVGFVKYDALATDTVDHVSFCAQMLHEEHLKAGGSPWVKPGEKMLYPEQIPYLIKNDPAVMAAIFHTGNTDGIFQFEEQIGKQISIIVKPDTIEEVADISTMIRPGCLQADCTWYEPNAELGGATSVHRAGQGLHFAYAARKFHGKMNPPPQLPEEVLKVLRPTHYCCIYQEQMMFLIEVITGGAMSLGEGDVYRRAIEHGAKGKKDAQETVVKMEAEMKKISPYPPEMVELVCGIIKGGAAYSFNKSHAVAYSIFSYMQAWFKHYHPHIFFAAQISLLAAKNKLEKAHKIINNARSMRIDIKAPHVLYSGDRASWSPDRKTIYLPMTVIKGIKDESASAIPRAAKGCSNALDFLLKARKEPAIRSNHLSALAKIGALDFDGVARIKTVAAMNYALDRATTKTKDETIVALWNEAMEWAVIGEFDQKRRTAAEIEVFGSFINESPLDAMVDQLEKQLFLPLTTIEPAPDKEFQVYFLVTGITKKVHKTGNSQGKEWLKLTCWDGHGVGEISVWAHDLEDHAEKGIRGYRSIIMENQVYCATVQADGQRPISLARRRIYSAGMAENRETLILM
jgi:DNA polymerase-3 subunit alpha